MPSKLSKKRARPVRLQDIAALANSSVATVSMALAGNPRISDETRRRIRSLSQELGYRPRRPAVPASLLRGSEPVRRLRFGFLVRDRIDIPHNATMLQTLSSAAEAQGTRLEVVSVPEDRESTPRHFIDRAIQLGKNVDGLILVGKISRQQLQQIREAAIPAVMYGFPFACNDEQAPAVPIVTSDWQAMGHRATRTLLDQGHRRIGFVSGHMVRGMWHERCLDGYILAHVHAGVDVDRRHIFVIRSDKDVASTTAETAAAVAAAKSLDEPPTAYVLVNQGNAERFHHEMARVGTAMSRCNTVICSMARAGEASPLRDCPQVCMDLPRLAETALMQLRAKCMAPASPNTIVVVPFTCENLPDSSASEMD